MGFSDGVPNVINLGVPKAEFNSLNVLSAKYYGTVSDMKADTTLKSGHKCVTLGYYSDNDGGGAIYKIRENNSDVVDNGFIHSLQNGLVAEIIVSKIFNVKCWGMKESNTSTVNGSIFYALLAKIEALGGGTIYFPEDTYRIQNTGNYIIKTDSIKFVGNGMDTIIRRLGNNPLINVVGISVKNTINPGSHNKYFTIENIRFLNDASPSASLKPIVYLECCSAVRIFQCLFGGYGSHLHFSETFDSRIISTDFTEGGRFTSGEFVDTLDYDNPSISTFSPSTILESGAISYNQQGYESTGLTLEYTNSIYFYGCRYESFRGGAIAFVGTNVNNIRIISGKFESLNCYVPHIAMLATVTQSSITDCQFYKPINSTTYGSKANIPFIFSNSPIGTTMIDINIGMTTVSSVKQAVPLLLLKSTQLSALFGNDIKVHLVPISSSGEQLLESTAYAVSFPENQHMLFCNGNKTSVLLGSYYNNFSSDYQPLPAIVAPPTTGYYRAGERLLFTAPDVDGNTEAICTASGSPGTWVLK